MANTEDYPTKWSTIHFGINAVDLSGDVFPQFRDLIQMQGAKVFIDGDGWQQWRAVPGTGANDTTTMHVQVSVQTKADAANAITSLRNSGLPFVPHVSPDVHGNPTRASVIATQAEDWSETFYTESFD